ncbi:YqcI/YcgG family protein, partial [Bacillus pumilus]
MCIRDSLRYGFVGDPREEEAVEELAQLLREYQSCAKETGQYASFICFFETPQDLKESSIEEFEPVSYTHPPSPRDPL